MAGFVLYDSLKVLTQNGECQIDLCFGDITQLKKEDKVDVIMISAFRGDYTPTPTSVVGALKRNLGVSVRTLARDKEEDLRNLYNCWWSKPLPDKLPYKRLLCFETKVFGVGHPQELVANVFRCLVPILNNKDGSVITPLLNTGDQGYGAVGMLNGMVVAAVNWMKAGLPLRRLKIILYAQVINDKLQPRTLRQFEDVTTKFAELKERYDSQYLVPKAVAIEFDVYLSFSEDDKGVVDAIQKRLKAAKADIKIFGEKQELNKEAVWQQDMYQVMMRSSRVITVLSPHYLKSTACIEQYNIALCCNRRAHRDMLAPIYIDSIELMPTYMGLVQYVDCRPHDVDKIHGACESLLGTMTIKIHLETLVMDPAPIQYDIFLSYSHRDDKIAKQIVKLLQKLDPKLRVFFDIQELKTGKAWQRTLYHSIDGSRCLLALISENYMKSAVCQEEYNLALAKHTIGDDSMQLIPVCIEDLKTVPANFSKIKMVKATPDVFEATTNAVCNAVVSWLRGKPVDKNVEDILKSDTKPLCNMVKVSEAHRIAEFISKYGTKDMKLLSMEKRFPVKLRDILQDKYPSCLSQSDQDVVHIVISCAPEDMKFATFLKAIFKDATPDLVVKIPSNDDKDRLSLMDNAKCVVAFLSPNYLDSPEQVEEFHIALCRQRVSPTTVLFPVKIHSLPAQPTYFHIVPSPLHITDELWVELATKWNVSVPMTHYLDDRRKARDAELVIPPEVQLGLHEAAKLLVEMLEENTSEKTTGGGYSGARPVLHNVLAIQDWLSQGSKAKDDAEISKVLWNLTLSDS